MRDDQQVRDAVRELTELGVADVNVDRVREVGRGVRHQQPGLEQLCGACTGDKLAVSPTGDVWPCVFARWLVLGNVQRSSLADIHGGQVASSVRTTMSAAFAARGIEGPRACGPDEWRDIFERVPRHLFVPRFHRRVESPDYGVDAYELIDGADR
jgi:iron-sulfur cluster protein